MVLKDMVREVIAEQEFDRRSKFTKDIEEVRVHEHEVDEILNNMSNTEFLELISMELGEILGW